MRIVAQLRSGRVRETTLMMCRAADVCCNRVSGQLVLADGATGVELPVTTRTGREAVAAVSSQPSCVGDRSRLCCEYEPTVQVVADGRLVRVGQRWHLEGATLCAP